MHANHEQHQVLTRLSTIVCKQEISNHNSGSIKNCETHLNLAILLLTRVEAALVRQN